jgi:hypothetical protein
MELVKKPASLSEQQNLAVTVTRIKKPRQSPAGDFLLQILVGLP